MDRRIEVHDHMRNKFKDNVCNKCKSKEACSDIPGFCLMLPYVAVVSVAILLIYFISNSHL